MRPGYEHITRSPADGQSRRNGGIPPPDPTLPSARIGTMPNAEWDADLRTQSVYTDRMTVATSPLGSTVGVRELKNQLSSFLDRVKAGEEITVTEHGRPVARLSAVAGDVDHMAALVAAGIVQPATKPHRRLPAKQVKIADGASSLADIVAEQRG